MEYLSIPLGVVFIVCCFLIGTIKSKNSTITSLNKQIEEMRERDRKALLERGEQKDREDKERILSYIHLLTNYRHDTCLRIYESMVSDDNAHILFDWAKTKKEKGDILKKYIVKKGGSL